MAEELPELNRGSTSKVRKENLIFQPKQKLK